MLQMLKKIRQLEATFLEIFRGMLNDEKDLELRLQYPKYVSVDEMVKKATP